MGNKNLKTSNFLVLSLRNMYRQKQVEKYFKSMYTNAASTRKICKFYCSIIQGLKDCVTWTFSAEQIKDDDPMMSAP
jgi:hypothetical protein